MIAHEGNERRTDRQVPQDRIDDPSALRTAIYVVSEEDDLFLGIRMTFGVGMNSFQKLFQQVLAAMYVANDIYPSIFWNAGGFKADPTLIRAAGNGGAPQCFQEFSYHTVRVAR